MLASALIRRPGHEAIELDLLADYQTNVTNYTTWHSYLRRHQPKTLITWGKNDPIFIAPGAEAYKRDLPRAELLWLDGGHFALEEHAPEVANAIRRVFGSHPM
jgi:pimeloyl-ACP methyl ester carboxylesterase